MRKPADPAEVTRIAPSRPFSTVWRNGTLREEARVCRPALEILFTFSCIYRFGFSPRTEAIADSATGKLVHARPTSSWFPSPFSHLSIEEPRLQRSAVTAAAATLPAPKPAADPNGELVLERPPRLPRGSDEARADRARERDGVAGAAQVRHLR